MAYALNQLRSQKNKKLLGERRGTLRDAYDSAHAAAAAANALDFYGPLTNMEWARLHAPELLTNEDFLQGMSLDEALNNFDSLVAGYSGRIRNLRVQQELSLQAIFADHYSNMNSSSSAYALDKTIEIIVNPISLFKKVTGALTDHAVGFVGERNVGVGCSVNRCELSRF